MVACELCLVDPGGEHRVAGEDGTYHQNITNTGKECHSLNNAQLDLERMHL